MIKGDEEGVETVINRLLRRGNCRAGQMAWWCYGLWRDKYGGFIGVRNVWGLGSLKVCEVEPSVWSRIPEFWNSCD